MKVATLIATAGFLAANVEAADPSVMTFNELQHRGIHPETALSKFQTETGALFTLNDLVKVSYEEEGNGIRLESLDHISIVIPLMEARPTENKADGAPV